MNTQAVVKVGNVAGTRRQREGWWSGGSQEPITPAYTQTDRQTDAQTHTIKIRERIK